VVRIDRLRSQERTIASGKDSKRNREMAGNTISLVRGSDRTRAAAVNEPRDTNSGIVPQNIMPKALVMPDQKFSASSSQCDVQLTNFAELF
jgi:hypothetical protein